METCSATVHGTRYAYMTGCRCPGARAANKAEGVARRAMTARGDGGCPPRYRWVDETAVYLAVVDPAPRKLGATERRLAAVRLRRGGMSALKIAQRLGVTERTVWRYLRPYRLVGAGVDGGAQDDKSGAR